MKKSHIGKHCSNLKCFKEKNYRTKFLTSSILKKSTKIILKKTQKEQKKEDNLGKKNVPKKRKKNNVGKKGKKYKTKKINK
jgi:hypothetical protein